MAGLGDDPCLWFSGVGIRPKSGTQHSRLVSSPASGSPHFNRRHPEMAQGGLDCLEYSNHFLLMTFAPRVVLQDGAEKSNLGPYQQLEVNRGMNGPRFWASEVVLVASACQCSRSKRCGVDPCVKKIPWRRKWQPIAVFLPGKCYRQRSLAGCNPLGCKESYVTKHSTGLASCLQNM